MWVRRQSIYDALCSSVFSDMLAVKDLLKSEAISVSNSKAENALLGQNQTVQILDQNPKIQALNYKTCASVA
jgi:hypothetical protein